MVRAHAHADGAEPEAKLSGVKMTEMDEGADSGGRAALSADSQSCTFVQRSDGLMGCSCAAVHVGVLIVADRTRLDRHPQKHDKERKRLHVHEDG